MDSISNAEARRIALTAQGFAEPRPRKASVEDVRSTIERLRLIQIDSVNVFARAHYMPLFSRLGPYRQQILDELAHREQYLYEQWAHVACYIPVSDYPMLRHRMARSGWWREPEAERLDYYNSVLEQVREQGPVVTGELDGTGKRQGWWGWSHAKIALEYQFARGNLAVRERRNFARVYDLAERVFPPEMLAAPALPAEDAHREMVRASLKALGVATVSDLQDYYRIKIAEVKPRIAELVDAGVAIPIRVEGWKDQAFLHPGAEPGPGVGAAAILSPFDPLIWDRVRTERMFGFHYRIEIYTPAPLRKHGYYVLPFLMDEAIAARVDLKANRQTGTLEVKAAHLEPGQSPQKVARALAKEMKAAARWLALRNIGVEPRGDLAESLAAALA